MAMPKDSFQNDIQENVVDTWKMFLTNMEKSLDSLEKGIQEASEMAQVCTSEWCEATEHVIDDLSNYLFSISEPRWANEEDSKKLKELKRRVHDLYANYREVYQKANP
jgi:small-conductance mechanosensitive channel